MNKIKLLLIPAIVAVMAFSSCKVCKDCGEFTGIDGNGNAAYSSSTTEKCGNELEEAEDEKVTGTSYNKYDCEL